MKPRNPRTAKEWQEAVNLAECFLRLDAARQYGLITGGPPVDVERCAELINGGVRFGIRPQEHLVEQFARALANGGEGKNR